MNTLSSMQYTIGTALDRARACGHVVELLVDHHWVAGLVVASDGFGVVLDHDGREHCVVRLERVSAVRVASGAPMLDRNADASRTSDAAMPMPGPRVPSE